MDLKALIIDNILKNADGSFSFIKDKLITLVNEIKNNSLNDSLNYHFNDIYRYSGISTEEFLKYDEIKNIYLDNIINGVPKRDDFYFDYSLLAIVNQNTSFNKIKENIPNLMNILKTLNIEQMKRFLYVYNTDLINDNELVNILLDKCKEEKDFIKFLPINEVTIKKGLIPSLLKYKKVGRELIELDDNLFKYIIDQLNEENYENLSGIEQILKDAYYSNKKKILLSNKYACKYFLSRPYSLIENDYEILYFIINNNFQLLNNLSYVNKMEIMHYIEDPEVQKYYIEKMQLLDNIEFHENYSSVRELKYILDKDFLIDRVINSKLYLKIDASSMINFVETLRKEDQIRLFSEKDYLDYILSFNEYEFKSIIRVADYSIMEKYYMKLNNLSFTDITELCKKNMSEKNMELLRKKAKEDYDNNSPYLQGNIYSDISFYLKLNGADYEYFMDLYNKSVNINNISLEVNNYINFDTPLEKERFLNFTKLRFENISNILKTSKNRSETVYSLNFLKYTDGEIRKNILDHINIECLLNYANSSDIVVDYLLGVIQNEYNNFKKLTLKKGVYFDGNNLSETGLENLKALFYKLPDNLKVYIIDEKLLGDDKIYDYAIMMLKNNPFNILTNEKLFENLFNSLNVIKRRELINNMKSDALVAMFTVNANSFNSNKDENIELFSERKEELLTNVGFVSKYNFIDYTMGLIKLGMNYNEIFSKLSVDSLINIFTYHDKLQGIIVDYLKDNSSKLTRATELNKFFQRLEKDDFNKILSNVKMDDLVEIYSLTLNKDVKERMLVAFKSQPYFMNNTIYRLEELLSRLDSDELSEILNKIDSEFKGMNFSNNLISNIRNISYDDKLFLINMDKRNLLTNEKEDYIVNLLKKDPFALKSLNVELFENNIFNLSKNIIPIIYRYKEVSKNYINVIKSNSNLARIMFILIENLNRKSTNLEVLTKKVTEIIDYLANSQDKLLINYNLDNITIDDVYSIENYILNKCSKSLLLGQKDVIHLFENERIYQDKSLKEIEEEKLSILDKKVEFAEDIREVKNAIFMKFFNINLETGELLVQKYISSINSVEKYIKEENSLNTFNFINSIVKINDINQLKSLYKIYRRNYAMDDLLSMNIDIENAYNTLIRNDIKGYKNSKMSTIEIDNNNVVVNKIEDKMEIFVHSTCAYGEMPMINGNYYDSWNYQERTNNDGICTAFISETNLGMPDITGNGVMFGFTNIDLNSIKGMAPYDIMSRNDSLDFSSSRPMMYMGLEDLKNNIRHTHSETVIKRRNTIESSTPLKQPDCIIIYEEMPKEIKNNSLKAQKDFMEKGINLPIVYLNRKELIYRQGKLITAMLDKFEKGYDLKLLKEIINKYESIRCGCDADKDIDLEQVLSKNRIYNDILKMVTNILNNGNNILKNEFLKIIKEEQDKFNLINETVGERAHKFDLLDDNLLNEIEKMNLMFSQNKSELKFS